MSRKDKQDRATELRLKMVLEDLTAQEEKELDRITDYLESPATDGQVDYIETLLGKLGADLDEYTDVTIEWLTFDEASDIIDQLKDDVTEAGAWEE